MNRWNSSKKHLSSLRGTQSHLVRKVLAVYTATLVPDTKFAAIARPLPIAFAQFQTDKNGKPTILRLTFSDGQAYDFKRE